MGSVYHWTIRQLPTLKEWMPSISMFGILYFTVVTTAAGQKQLLQIGHWLLLAAILHNLAGYVFGYGLGRACRLDEASSRAIAFEVAMQNGGMASGLAGGMGKLATVGLAAAIFSPWMNISGSILAYFWSHSASPHKNTMDPCDDVLS
jgi:BASS family bile acid:Na+ symporter